MVQAPPSLLSAGARRLPSSLSLSPSASSSSPYSSSGPASGSTSCSEAAQHGSSVRIKQQNHQQQPRGRVPSYTSSPLTQRPLSPSLMSDSGSESSASTAVIDIPEAKHGVHAVHHRKSRSITALTFDEALHSSSSDDDEDTIDFASNLQARAGGRLASSSKVTLEHLAQPPMQSKTRSRTSPSPLNSSAGLNSLSTTPPYGRSNRRRRSSGHYGHFPAFGESPSPASPSFSSSSFVGSYEHSLLSGRMSNKPANNTALPFTARLGVLGLGKHTPKGLKSPSHIQLDFGAYFWEMDNQERQGKSSPYVGLIDLEEYFFTRLDEPSYVSNHAKPPKFPGYRIPPRGQIQLVIRNANQTTVKLFLVPYDLTDMPPSSKTFLRQKSYDMFGENPAGSIGQPTSPSAAGKDMLQYAVHLQFCSTPLTAKEERRAHQKSNMKLGKQPAPAERTASHIYLHKNIRVVFAPTGLNMSEKLKVVLEGPTGSTPQQGMIGQSPVPGSPLGDLGRFTAYAGPGEDWNRAMRRKGELGKAFESGMSLEESLPKDAEAAPLQSMTFAQLSHEDSPRPFLLNTPPSDLASSVLSSMSLDAAFASESVPVPLVFERSPTPKATALPSIESGLSISRPGSRAGTRRGSPTSPEPILGTLPEGCLR